MNKDLDERLVPNGEYRDALNAQVTSSDDSDVGSLQNLLGNLDISSEFFIDPVTGNVVDTPTLDAYGFYCVGSVVDEKSDRLYWLVSGMGIDFIAEYDYTTKKVSPIVVDIFPVNLLPGDDGRVLSFDKGFLITGINIVEDMLFWTDNNTEPKRINIPQIRIGTFDFLTHTDFYVPNPDKTSSQPFVLASPLKLEHITVIRKGPNTAPKLEMKNTTVGDFGDVDTIPGEVTTTYSDNLTSLWDTTTGAYTTNAVSLTFDDDPDFQQFDVLEIEEVDSVTGSLKKRKITVEIVSVPTFSGGQLTCDIEVRSWDLSIDLSNEDFNVVLQQESSFFEFKFPRFGCRYKYKDGEYSAFSPFSEIAFLPGGFDYLPKEGYNLGMVNTVRSLGVCDFVDERYIPEDVIAIDILYKESNSPSVYSVKSIDKVDLTSNYDCWNAISPTNTRGTSEQTYGYLKIESSMIHSVLPENQLLRPWDNVPRKALAQEVIGNRIIYANYLQNYSLSSANNQTSRAIYDSTTGTSLILNKSKNIEVDLSLSQKVVNTPSTANIAIAEELDAGKAYSYQSAKTIKSLRTYQLGVIYIDEFGRETPVFSASKTSRNSHYQEKQSAPLATKLAAQIKSPQPDFAKNFKFLIKETSNEYYNLAMDRWYNADDGNIWITFPSADRNKVDLETFLILKKAHKSNDPVTDLAKYKILDIKNEAPRFVKTRRTALRTITDGFVDSANGIPVLMDGGNEDPQFPFTGGRFIDIHNDAIASVIDTFESEDNLTNPFQFRIISAEGASNFYDIKSFTNKDISTSTTPASSTAYWRITASKDFGEDMSITTSFNTTVSASTPAYGNCKVEFVKREEKNLPEFEGRFFVKILKDAELQENLLGYFNYTGNWSVVSSIKSQYINPFSNDIGLYPSTGGNWYGFNKQLMSIDAYNTDTGVNPIGNGDGQYYWNHAGQTENTNSESSGWFIDSVEAFRPFRYTNRFYKVTDHQPYEAVVDNTFNSSWSNYNRTLNTNLSTAITDHADVNGSAWGIWTSTFPLGVGVILNVSEDYPKRQLQLIGDCTNAVTHGQGSTGSAGGYLGISDVLAPHEGSFSPPTGSKPVIQSADEGLGGKILPARGIDQANNLIHLSRAGIGWFNPTAVDLPNAYDVTASFDDYLDPATFNAVDYVNDLEFIISISTPGTVWRWKEDPGKVVYQTQQGPPSSSGITQVEWDASQNDALDARPGTQLFNYTKIADYTTTHKVDLKHSLTGTTLLDTRWVPNLASQGIQSYDIIKPNLASLAVFSTGDLVDLTQKELIEFKPQSDNHRWPMFTQGWDQAQNKRRRYTIHAKPLPLSSQGITGNEGLGGVAPHFYLPTNPTDLAPHFDHNGAVLTTVPTTDAPGIRPDGVYSGRDGVVSYTLNSVASTKIPSLRMTDGTLNSPAPGSVTWQILEKYDDGGSEESGYFTSNPAVWETEPKEDVGLEIYHEVGQIYPTELNEETVEQFFGPIHTDLSRNSKVTCWMPPPAPGWVNLQTTVGSNDIRISQVSIISDRVFVWLSDINGNPLNPQITSTTPPIESRLIFTRADGSVTEINVKDAPAVGGITLNSYEVYTNPHNYQVTLPWFNAYSFGNGVESNRIRDDYNQVIIDKGPKVSTVLEEPYTEERRSSGFIWSGIYNSRSGVNNLNQFIQAEKITKDLNPIYGSIQKLFARNTDLVTLCEDKVFRVLANKDALFNADGNVNITATQNVLGQTVPFAGDYGISKNPESFAADAYRLYFSDRTRGSVLRLSQDGLTPISSYGMKNWFADNLSNSNRVIGSFDDKKKEYNISLSYYNYKTYPVKIIGARKQVGSPVSPTANLEVTLEVANKFKLGDEITGPGIPIGNIVVSKTNIGGGNFRIKMSHPPSNQDVSILENYTCGDVDCLDLWWNTMVSVSIETIDPVTLSYSETTRGWPSFKSFHLENGLSLNNDYFTFKKGQLYQHHINDIHNNFYGEQYDSSVEVLFNELPGSVKSFQSLDYEGSQSKITSDGGLNETSNSGEYWDNYDKLGWYVDNMRTDLQELEPAEFKNKEGKWFSAIKGVATEWLDDGKAGNIDTREFSYQGIDEAGAITVLDGDYTSWDCVGNNCVEIQGLTGAYPDELTCLADSRSACSPICQTPNVITVHANDAVNVSCSDGDISIEVYLAGTAVSWTVQYFDTSNNLVLVDPSTYAYNGYSNSLQLPQGSYYAIVTDDLLCEEQVNFTVGCKTTSPCSTNNPHDFKPLVTTNPVWDINLLDCWTPFGSGSIVGSGTVKISNNSLTAPAINWGVELYSIVGGVSTMIHSQIGLVAGDSIEVDGLEAGDYEYIITDDQGCEYPAEQFTLICVGGHSTCTTPHITVSTTPATSNDGCATDNTDGLHEVTGVTLDPSSVNFTVQYYEIPNPTWNGGAGAVAIGSSQGPFSAAGFSATNTSGSIGHYDQLKSYVTSQQNYAVVVTDDQGCEVIEEFTINCISGVGNPCANGPITAVHVATDSTSLQCVAGNNMDGFHTIQSVNLPSGATQFQVEYFDALMNPLSSSPLVAYPSTAVMVQADGSAGLGPTAPLPSATYYFKITDILGCNETFSFTVGCQSISQPGCSTGQLTRYYASPTFPFATKWTNANLGFDNVDFEIEIETAQLLDCSLPGSATVNGTANFIYASDITITITGFNNGATNVITEFVPINADGGHTSTQNWASYLPAPVSLTFPGGSGPNSHSGTHTLVVTDDLGVSVCYEFTVPCVS